MEIENLLIKIASILRKFDIPYLITGGIAVTVWGRPRATFDIDIVVELKKANILPLLKSLRAFSKAGYVNEEAAKQALKEKGEFNFIHPDTGLKVDFWVKKDTIFSEEEFKRKIAKKIKEEKIYFISPEDLILEKLLWYKQSFSTRQLEDIESVLRISKVDLKYIEKWTKRQSTFSIFKKLKVKS